MLLRQLPISPVPAAQAHLTAPLVGAASCKRHPVAGQHLCTESSRHSQTRNLSKGLAAPTAGGRVPSPAWWPCDTQGRCHLQEKLALPVTQTVSGMRCAVCRRRTAAWRTPTAPTPRGRQGATPSSPALAQRCACIACSARVWALPARLQHSPLSQADKGQRVLLCTCITTVRGAVLQPDRYCPRAWLSQVLPSVGLKLQDKPGGTVAGLGCRLLSSAFLAAPWGPAVELWSWGSSSVEAQHWQHGSCRLLQALMPVHRAVNLSHCMDVLLPCHSVSRLHICHIFHCWLQVDALHPRLPLQNLRCVAELGNLLGTACKVHISSALCASQGSAQHVYSALEETTHQTLGTGLICCRTPQIPYKRHLPVDSSPDHPLR